MARLFVLVPFVTLLGLAATACSAPADSDARVADDQNITGHPPAGGSTGPLMTLPVGQYDFDLQLTHDTTRGILTGHFASSVGDPEHGGASSEFYFITDENHHSAKAPYSIVWFNSEDGKPLTGTLEFPTTQAIKLQLDSEPFAFSRVCPACGDIVRGAEFKFSKAADATTGAHAMRRVKSAKAHFSDSPGGPERKAFVIANQFVGVQGVKGGSSLATFRGLFASSETRGYIKESDLVSLDADLSH